jgi:hypothetical protein
MGALWGLALRPGFDRAESFLRIPSGKENPVENEELGDPQRAVGADVGRLYGDDVPAR